MTENDVLPLAQDAARSYCRKYSAFDQFDDAVGDACLYLLAHRDKWQRDYRQLKRRVVGELVRGYQREHGLRLKRPPRRVERDLELVATIIGDRNDCDALNSIVQRALRQPDVADIAPIVRFVLDGKVSEASKLYGISKSSISKIKRRFSIVCLRIKNEDEDVPDTAENRAVMPLFFNERP